MSMPEDKILITNKNQIEVKHKNKHEAFEYNKYEVTGYSKNLQSCVTIYEIPPQKSNYPYHYHLKNEETFYIISGTGVIETPDGEKSISAGDVIFCPPSAEGAHRIINTSQTELLVYVDFDTVNDPDVVYYPHSNKVGIIQNGVSSTFYKKDSNVDYFDGE